MSEANRHAESKDPYRVASRGGLERSFHPTSTSDKHGGPHTDRPPPKIQPSFARRADECVHPYTILLAGNHSDRNRAGHDRSLPIG
jgi:hypothetical protein